MILTINDTSKNIHNQEIFILTDSIIEFRSKFSKICKNRILFEGFVSAVYKTVFERTSIIVKNRSKSLSRIPEGFQKEHHFVRLIDSLRHNFGGHDTRSDNFTKSKNQLDRAEILIELKGNAKELEENDMQYFDMQLKVLDFFYIYLRELHDSIE